MAAGAILRIIDEDGATSRIPLQESLMVGRGENADLRFREDRCVSPRHAQFNLEEGLLTVEDLGSVNGVFVRVKEPVRLVNRDRLRIGDHVFSFEIIPQLDAKKSNITKVFADPNTDVIGTSGERALARLVMHLDTGHRGKEYFIGEFTIVLGRGGGTHNFMSDRRISERHARISPMEDQGFELADLGSEFGTWRQTRGRIGLEPDTELLIGRQRIQVESIG